MGRERIRKRVLPRPAGEIIGYASDLSSCCSKAADGIVRHGTEGTENL